MCFKKLFSSEVTKKQMIKCGILGGVGEAVYIFLVALFFMNVPFEHKLTGGLEVFAPILMLMLFVFSALVSGVLLLGYPVYLALQKNYKEAFTIVGICLLTLFILLALTVVLIFVLA